MGIGSWFLAGLLVGWTVRLILRRPQGPATTPLVAGIGGAVAGGLLATYLGFGGLLAFDVRSLTVAALAALLAVLAAYLLQGDRRI